MELDGSENAYNFSDDKDYFTQTGDLFRIINADGKADALFNNRAAHVGVVKKFIQIHHIRNWFKADSGYGDVVAKALSLTIVEVNSFNIINRLHNPVIDKFW